MPLRLRRGTNAERLTITPIEGELIYTTDTKQVFIGDGNTVGGRDIVTSVGGTLTAGLNLNGNTISGVGNIDIIGLISNGVFSLNGNTFTSNSNVGNIDVIGFISNGTLTLNGNVITSSESFVANGSGNTIGILNLSTSANLLQVQRRWSDPQEPIEITYGVTNGFSSIVEIKNASRGTVNNPVVVQQGDVLSYDRTFGYDGFDYVASSGIWQGVDLGTSPSPGFIPGAIALITEGLSGQNVLSFNSKGYLGINKFPVSALEALDVNGNGLFSGSVTASSFVGPVYANDSTLLLDSNIGHLSNGVTTISFATLTTDIPTFTIDTSSIITGNLTVNQSVPGPEALNGNISVNGKISLTQNTAGADYESIVGITSGFGSLGSSRFSSRGSLEFPQTINSGDCISYQANYGYDGSEYRLSSVLWCGVDYTIPVEPGVVPGTILFFTFGDDGLLNESSGFDAQGYLGIRNGIISPAEALDVYGNAIIRGDLSVGGKLTLRLDDPSAEWEAVYGVTGGFLSLASSKLSSRGTLDVPEAVQPGDNLSTQVSWGYDGNNYSPSSVISFNTDPNASISPGVVPGSIYFITFGAGGPNNSSGFNSKGYFGLNNGILDPEEFLDVYGNAIIRGNLTAAAFKGTFVADDSSIIIDGATSNVTGNQITAAAFKGTFVADDSSIIIDGATSNVTGNQITAAAFKGTFVADDSTIIVDGVNGNVTGNTVTSNGFVMFGSYDATARSGLTAANGMVIYNTTANRFQGYQNGAWINLDDGTAAP